jgi:hypothetical protein
MGWERTETTLLRRSTAFAAVVFLAVLAVPHGRAVGSGGTRCEYVHDPDVSPGISLQGSTGTINDDPAHPGTIECDGPVLGVVPTGPGAFRDPRRLHHQSRHQGPSPGRDDVLLRLRRFSVTALVTQERQLGCGSQVEHDPPAARRADGAAIVPRIKTAVPALR